MIIRRASSAIRLCRNRIVYEIDDLARPVWVIKFIHTFHALKTSLKIRIPFLSTVTFLKPNIMFSEPFFAVDTFA